MLTMSMDLQYSPVADALYVQFIDQPVAYSEDVSQSGYYNRGVDYAEDDTPVGVEFLNVSQGINLTNVPHANEIAQRLPALRIRLLPPKLSRTQQRPA